MIVTSISPVGRNDAKAETPVLWPPHEKSWLIGKDSDIGRGWGEEEKGTTEDEMAGWHHWLNGCEFEWTPGDGDGQGGLACCNSWGCKELDTTERLNWTELNRRRRNQEEVARIHRRTNQKKFLMSQVITMLMSLTKSQIYWSMKSSGT